MKKIYKIKHVAIMGSLALGATLSSCNDWLTLYPKDKIVEENFWEDKKDLESVRYEAYKNMISSSNLNKYLIWGELRSDNFDRNTTVTDQDLMDLMNVNLQPSSSYFDWSGFYATINYCNKVIQHGPEILEKDLSFSEGDWEAIRAEMYALRALNYFYLTRTFDSIPLIMNAINDDSEVTRPKASSQKAVLDTLVNQLEYICTTNMVEDYGNASDNKGLITDKAVHTILADIYLWRASIQERADKTAADADYNKCIEHCDYVITKMDKEYQEENNSSRPGLGGSTTDTDNPYHLYQNKGRDNVTMTDGAYNYIFGNKNSRESIFELQMDGTKNNNSMVTTFYRGTGDAGSVGSIVASDQVGNNCTTADAATGGLFYKTDLRRWETFYSYEEGKYCVAKYAAQTINQKKISDNSTATGTDKVNPSWRTSASANWIFYRISDVLLMKAEALCRLNGGAEQFAEAFALVEQIYNRSNPIINSTEDKLNSANYKTQEALEALILRERRREFYGEGKRWFDVVRYALRQENSSEAAFELIENKFTGSLLNIAKNKYKQGVQVLYAPIYETELKANPNLNQNPIWSQSETIVKN